MAKNPLFPGYYSGDKPFIRSSKGSSINEFIDPQAFLSSIDIEVAKALEGVEGIPKWFKDRFGKGITDAFEVTAKGFGPDDSTNVEIGEIETQYGEEETEEAPGISPKFDFLKFAKDPLKYPAKTFWKYAKQTVDLGDFGRQREKNFWSSLILDDATPPAEYSSVTRSIIGRDFTDLKIAKKNAFSEEGSYKKVSDSLLSFVEKSDSKKLRGGSYRTFQSNTLAVFKKELSEGGLDTNLHTAHNTAIKFIEEMGAFNKALRTFNKEVAKEAFRKEGIDITKEGFVGFKDTFSSLKDSWDILHALPQDQKKHVASFLGSLDIKSFDKLFNTVDDIASRGADIKPRDAFGVTGLMKKTMTTGNLISNKGNPLKAGLLDNVLSSYLEKFFEEGDLVESVGTIEGRKLKSLYGVMRRRRDAAEIEDFLDKLTSDLTQGFTIKKVFNAYVWTNKLKTRFEKFTPAYWIEKGLGRVNYFGAKIDEENSFPEFLGFLKGFKNEFVLEIPDLGISLRTIGGKWGKAPELLGTLKGKGALFIDNLRSSGDGTAKEFFKWLHLDENKETFSNILFYGNNGKLLSTEENYQGILNIMGGLKNADKSFSKVTRQYLGWLEKYGQALNRAQSKIYKFVGERFTKILTAGTALKTALSKAISAAIVAATGGISKALGRWIEAVVSYIVDKVWNKVVEFLKIVAKFDFKKLSLMAEKQLEKSVRTFSKVAIGCTVLIFGPAFLVMTVITSSISPTDPTREEGFEASGMGEFLPATLAGTSGKIAPGGSFGSGKDCSSITYPIPGWTSFSCYHWDGNRALDMWAFEGSIIQAPFAGTAFAADYSLGGHTVILHPNDSCYPSLYFAHMQQGNRASGATFAGGVIGLLSDSGSANGRPHLHLGASTIGFFEGAGLDVCTPQLLQDLTPYSCVPEDNYGGPPLCCSASYPDGSGCTPAVNQ